MNARKTPVLDSNSLTTPGALRAGLAVAVFGATDLLTFQLVLTAVWMSL